MNRALAGLLAMVPLAAVTLAGCGQSCTFMGVSCPRAFRVEVRPSSGAALPEGRYEVKVTTESPATSASCVLGETCSNTHIGDISIHETDVVAGTKSPVGIDVEVRQAAALVTVTVERDGQVVALQTFEPVYRSETFEHEQSCTELECVSAPTETMPVTVTP